MAHAPARLECRVAQRRLPLLATAGTVLLGSGRDEELANDAAQLGRMAMARELATLGPVSRAAYDELKQVICKRCHP